MGNFFAWTGFYLVKYIAYIAIVVGAVFVGKAWGDHSKEKKQTIEKDERN